MCRKSGSKVATGYYITTQKKHNTLESISLEDLVEAVTKCYYGPDRCILFQEEHPNSDGSYSYQEYWVRSECTIIDSLIIHFRGDIEKINNCIISLASGKHFYYADEIPQSTPLHDLGTYELVLTDLEYAELKDLCKYYRLHFNLPIDEILERIPDYQSSKDIGWGGSEHRFFKGCGYEMHMSIGVNGLYLKLIDRENHDYTVADWEVELEEISMMTLQDLQRNINKTLKLQKIHDRKNVDSYNLID